MERMHIDVVCFTGHKSLMGPQGTGGLCIRPGVEIRPFAVGGTGVQSYSETQPAEYPTRLEAGTLNSHGLAGLGASLEYLGTVGWERVRAHETALARQFYTRSRVIPNVKLYGDYTLQERAPIVTLNIDGLDSLDRVLSWRSGSPSPPGPAPTARPGSTGPWARWNRGQSASPGPISIPGRRRSWRRRRSAPLRRRLCDHAGKNRSGSW